MLAAPSHARRVFGAGSRLLQVVDCHAEGEPARVVVGGMPHVPGSDMRARRDYFMQHLDHYRKLLLHEPRGYPCQNADFVTPPVTAEAAFGVLIAEQGFIYPAMSGHNVICVATALLETGMVPMEEPRTEFALDLPAGLVRVSAECANGKAVRVTLRNAPSFCRPADMGVVVDVPHGVGKVTCDIAYGGMFYVIVDAASVGLKLDPANGKELCRVGEMIKVAAREQHPVDHPEFSYPGPDILVFREPAERRPAAGAATALHANNTVVMSNGQLDWARPETWTGMLDRSPCGTGTCAVMAALHARGELALNEDFVHSSILGCLASQDGCARWATAWQSTLPYGHLLPRTELGLPGSSPST